MADHDSNVQIFSNELCDALFSAVLVHDDIHPDSTLPDAIHFDYTQTQFEQCYRICLQIWRQGTSREALLQIRRKVQTNRALTAQEQLDFKYMRAKFKHLRFAYMTLDRRHQYPKLFHYLTGEMGNLQDALKNQQYDALGRPLFTLKLFLSRPSYALMTSKLQHFQVSDRSNFKAYIQKEIAFVHAHLATTDVTSKAFHETRKVISRLVALYDNLKILFPSDYHEQVSRFLSTLNGLMGGMHDQLIVQKFKDEKHYYSAPIEIPLEIKKRLTELIEKFGTAH